MNRRVAAAVAVLALLAAAVRAVLNRKVRETDELIDRMRAGQTPVLDDDIGDDIVAMVKAWQDEVGRP